MDSPARSSSLHPNQTIYFATALTVLAGLYGCPGDVRGEETAHDYNWQLPAGFPEPMVPDDNPMTADKVELGRHLFYDRNLSANQTQSCGSCHIQSLAFTDGEPVGLGSTGEAHSRSSMSLVNVGYASTLTWANPVMRTLERQALVPLFGEHPVELGLVGMEDTLLQRLMDEPVYDAQLAKAFPEANGLFTLDHVTKALAAFQRTLISGNSPFDRYENGDPAALSASEKRGMQLFFSEELECFHCHGGFNFSDSTTHLGKAFEEIAFHNTGLYNVDGAGGYPEPNVGLFSFSENPSDMGRFKAPTLRNIGITAPYMHDGSVATLSDTLDHYAAGGRTLETGIHAGIGSQNPNRSEFVTGFELSQAERRDVIAFLHALTDEQVLNDPRFSDPWPDP